MSEIALPIAGVPGLLLPGPSLSDERLARLASGGSTGALAVLYERHHQALYRYCRSIVGNHEDAQDALQSAMTRAFIALRANERDLAVRPWLFRIAHNEAVSILRKRRPTDGLVDEHERSDVSVELAVDQRERLAVLVADLQALPERQRAALLMRELSGLSIEEIAAALSVSLGAAKQTLFEARSSLHEFAEGRAMECETVRRAISDGDGRVLRGRRISTHLRGCAGCRDFRALNDTRRADLRVLVPPLPATAATAMLARVLAHGAGGGHAGGAAAASGVALGNHAAASLVAKGLVSIAVIVAAGAGTIRLANSLARHKHSPTRGTPVVVAHARALNRAGVVVSTATHHRDTKPVTSRMGARVRSTGIARTARGRVGSGHGALVSNGIPSQASPGVASSATSTLGRERTSSQHLRSRATGDARRTRGNAVRRSPKVKPTPRQPQRSRRSPLPSKPIGPSTPPQSQGSPRNGKPQRAASQGSGRQGAGGEGPTPQAKAPIGQPPTGTGKGDPGSHTTGTPPAPSQATSHPLGGK